MENLSWCLWKGCKLTCQFEESTKTNDRGFTPYLWNAAVIGDNKPSFLLAMADWIQNWQEKKIPNCGKFTLTSQTASAFVRTLKCHP